MATLKSMNREELNAEATRLGIANADQLEKNADVITAIEGSDTYKAEQEAAAKAKADADAAKAKADADAAKAKADADAASAADEPAAPKTTYIVNGVEVDPNGKPVKG